MTTLIDDICDYFERELLADDAEPQHKEAIAKIIERHRSSPSSAWPDFIAPPKYENAAPGWEDPRLPDFRLIWQTARECGYAIGLHGSMKRDVDLIAVPWTDEAAKPTQLINSLCVALNAKQIGAPEFKPQGRVSVVLQIDAYVKHIDLSIMPCLPAPPK